MKITDQDLARVSDLLSLAKLHGAEVQVSLSFPLHPVEETPALADPVQATVKTALWALNRLLAAPGQPNRDLVRRWLFTRGWIKGNEEPESWDLSKVPVTKEELKMIVAQVRQFEADAKTPAHP